jgi:hypothetical protein
LTSPFPTGGLRCWPAGIRAEIHDDETAATAVGVLRRAVAWFAAREITIERVLSDDGSAHRSPA